MTTYSVTAANKFFWQTLAVTAPDADQASAMFDDYLAADQNQKDEQYEYDQQRQIVNGRLDSEDEKQPDRADYVYHFYADDIEENDGTAFIPAVTLLESGGNG